MLSSTSTEENIQSPIISRSSSSSSSLLQKVVAPRRRRNMEDVWKDINFSSLHNQHSHNQNNNNPIIRTTTQATTLRPDTFQDFLERPFRHNNNNVSSPSTSSPPNPATALSLNTGSEFRYILDGSPKNMSRPMNNNNNNNNPMVYLASPTINNTNPFENLVVSSSFPISRETSTCCSTISSIATNPHSNPAERKHKRLIKNRESAARSRARKQERAYTNELEHTIEELKEENKRLIKLQEELCQAPLAQPPKKRGLQRTSTAPF